MRRRALRVPGSDPAGNAFTDPQADDSRLARRVLSAADNTSAPGAKPGADSSNANRADVQAQEKNDGGALSATPAYVAEVSENIPHQSSDAANQPKALDPQQDLADSFLMYKRKDSTEIDCKRTLAIAIINSIEDGLDKVSWIKADPKLPQAAMKKKELFFYKNIHSKLKEDLLTNPQYTTDDEYTLIVDRLTAKLAFIFLEDLLMEDSKSLFHNMVEIILYWHELSNPNKYLDSYMEAFKGQDETESLIRAVSIHFKRLKSDNSFLSQYTSKSLLKLFSERYHKFFLE